MSIKRNIKIIIFLLISVISLFFLNPVNKLIARDKLSTPLVPGTGQSQNEIGLFAGIGPDFQSGSFRAICNCPEFENGYGTSWIAGLLYEQDIDQFFQFGGSLFLSSMTAGSSYQIWKDRNFSSTIKGVTYYDTLPVLFRQKADISFINFNIMPYIKWTPSKIFFVRLGLGIGFNIFSNLTHNEEIVNRIVKLPSTGENVEVTFSDGSSSYTVNNESYPDVVSTQLYLIPAFGFTIPLSLNVFLSPVIDYHMPLTNISNYGNGFSISGIHFIAELRWALKLRN